MWYPIIKYTTPKRMKQLERNTGGEQYVIWRKAVLERDNFQCQWAGCNEKEGLQIHHIKRWADAPSLRHNPFNGITLCGNHHRCIYGREKFYEITFLQRAIANNKLYEEKKKNENPDRHS